MAHALLLLFPGFNTLDVNAPLEVFNKAGFKVTIASESVPTTSTEGAIMTRDVCLDQQLIDQLENYDLLIVPGANMGPIKDQSSKTDSYFMRLISAFNNLTSAPSGAPPRILLSICTGAYFLATLGIFNSAENAPQIYCTSHWGIYSDLDKMNKSTKLGPQGGPRGMVLPARFVDNGPVSSSQVAQTSQVRLISAGGVSCALDASLHVVKLRSGSTVAFDTAMLIDYAWRKTEGVTFNDLSTA